MRASCDEHQAITDAVIGGDGELAAKRLRAHVAAQGERFSDLMATLDRAKVVAGG